MSSFEIGYCPLEEFNAGEKSKIMESELCVEGLYTVMFLLGGDEHQAAKYPSLVTSVVPRSNDGSKVAFTIMSDNQAGNLKTNATFQQGFWQQANSDAIMIDEYQVRCAYFRQPHKPGDGGEQELQDMIQNSLFLPAQVEPSRPLVAA